MSSSLAAILISAALLLAGGCTSQPAGQNGARRANTPAAAGGTPRAAAATPDAGRRTLACSLLKSEEIQAVQGEAVKETKGSDSASEGLAVSHCVYLLPTYVKSLSLDIVRRDPAGSRVDSVEQFWAARFHRGEEGERERDREREGEEEGAKPRPVAGLGEEAFWVGGRAKGVLYIRQRGAVITLSLGGADDEATKISKSKTLLLQALKRIE
jgi:hypothetical protein